MKSRIISRLVLILGFLVLAFSIAFYSQEVIRLVKWRSRGILQSVSRKGADKQLVFSRIDKLLAGLEEEVKKFAEGKPLSDDLTLLAMRVRE